MDDVAKERFAQIVRELRGRDTQRVFAEKVEVAQSTICEWEKGNIKTEPKPKTLRVVAQLKGWSIEELENYLSGEAAKNSRMVTLSQVRQDIWSLPKSDVWQLVYESLERLQSDDSGFSGFNEVIIKLNKEGSERLAMLIEQTLDARNWNRYQLAEALAMGVENVNALASGSVMRLSESTLQKLASILYKDAATRLTYEGRESELLALIQAVLNGV